MYNNILVKGIFLMDREVKLINGEDLNDYDICYINSLYEEVFDGDEDYNVETKEELSTFYDRPLNELYFLIGEDWFLVFSKKYEYVEFLLWAFFYLYCIMIIEKRSYE